MKPITTPNVSPVVLVTGASSGLGKAIVERLSGCSTVYGTTRTNRPLTGCHRLTVDITDARSVQVAIDHVLSIEGRLDVLVNNAGSVLSGPGEWTSEESALRQMDVNFMGAVRMTNAVLPTMRSQGAGLILNISSMAAAIPLPYRSIDAASKAALEAWAWSLRPEVKSFGIGVTCLQVGDCRTELSQHGVSEFGQSELTQELTSAYPTFDAAYQRYCTEEANGWPPSALAERVESIIHRRTSRLRFRYTAGTVAQRMLFACRHLLPDWAIEALMSSMYLPGSQRNMSHPEHNRPNVP